MILGRLRYFSENEGGTSAALGNAAVGLAGTYAASKILQNRAENKVRKEARDEFKKSLKKLNKDRLSSISEAGKLRDAVKSKKSIFGNLFKGIRNSRADKAYNKAVSNANKSYETVSRGLKGAIKQGRDEAIIKARKLAKGKARKGGLIATGVLTGVGLISDIRKRRSKEDDD